MEEKGYTKKRYKGLDKPLKYKSRAADLVYKRDFSFNFEKGGRILTVIKAKLPSGIHPIALEGGVKNTYAKDYGFRPFDLTIKSFIVNLDLNNKDDFPSYTEDWVTGFVKVT